MGYCDTLLHGRNPKEVFLSDYYRVDESENYYNSPLDYSYKGNIAFIAWEVTEKQINNTYRIISVHLIRKDQEILSVKSMDETECPCYYDCPLKLLKLVESSTPYNDFSREWRGKVREYHRKAKEERNDNKCCEIIEHARYGTLYVIENLSPGYALCRMKGKRSGKYIALQRDTGKVFRHTRYREIETLKKEFTKMLTPVFP